MPMCIGKISVDKEGIIGDLPYAPFGLEVINESRNLELGDYKQSLTDIFLSKLLEGLLGEAEVIKDGEDLRVEYTNKNSFWITIRKTSTGYEIRGSEPAA